MSFLLDENVMRERLAKVLIKIQEEDEKDEKHAKGGKSAISHTSAFE